MLLNSFSVINVSEARDDIQDRWPLGVTNGKSKSEHDMDCDSLKREMFIISSEGLSLYRKTRIFSSVLYLSSEVLQVDIELK
jgi:hypothetical protein